MTDPLRDKVEATVEELGKLLASRITITSSGPWEIKKESSVIDHPKMYAEQIIRGILVRHFNPVCPTVPPEIRELSEKATQGEWRVDKYGGPTVGSTECPTLGICTGPRNHYGVAYVLTDGSIDDPVAMAVAQIIVACVNGYRAQIAREDEEVSGG
ncbi:hypothetical protein KAR91_10435 [Candidatus Pacearchaeota archaeon]|nr:hypothetical protein [Candidatus Pacearchaeota archaeon]